MSQKNIFYSAIFSFNFHFIFSTPHRLQEPGGSFYSGRTADIWSLGITLYCLVFGRYLALGSLYLLDCCLVLGIFLSYMTDTSYNLTGYLLKMRTSSLCTTRSAHRGYRCFLKLLLKVANTEKTLELEQG